MEFPSDCVVCVILETLPLWFDFAAIQVVNHYLSCVLPSQHALVLEKLRYTMPNNAELGLRYAGCPEQHRGYIGSVCACERVGDEACSR